jgi:hypothetical protein
MKTKRLATFLALALVATLIAYFPPGPFSWRTFILDQSPTLQKVLFLGKVYLVPAVLAFLAVIGFRVQMAIAVSGASPNAVFPLALLASIAMMAALRSMSGGVGGVPGYAVGMALGYTLMSSVHGLQKTGETLLGRPLLKIVWRKPAGPSAPPQEVSAAA